MDTHSNPGLRESTRPAYHPDLLEVQIEPDAVIGLAMKGSTGAARFGDLPESIGGPLRFLQTSRQLRQVIPVFAAARPDFGRTRIGAQHVTDALVHAVRATDSTDLAGTVLLRVSERTDINAIRKDFASARGVRRAHLVPLRWLDAAGPDPLQNRQWGLRAINWFDRHVHDAATVGVAILDTGIDEGHPDLSPSGYFHDGTSATDIVGHGTHVAGIIAATTNNDIGITGIAGCKINAYKIFSDEPASDGQYYVDPLMYRRALNAVHTSGDRIVNLSIGGTAEDPTEKLLFSRLEAAGVLAVAAMGNDYERGNPVEYPGAFKSVVAVGAINEANQRAPFSNTGPRITIAAPGTNILSTLPMQKSTARPTRADTGYAAWSGTSMATPHVAAALALLFAKLPQLSAVEAVEKLTKSASRLPQMRGQTSHEFGAGLLNLAELLR